MHVYFISGLAADRSVFKYIQLPPHCKAFYLDWIQPQLHESLPAYALRLGATIDTTQPVAIIGLSMGGMIAVEIAKQLQPAATVLISSIPSVQQLPVYFNLAGTLRLHKIIPIGFIQQAAVIKRFFTKETPEDKRLLKAMIRKSDAGFIRWAMNAVLTWQNKDVPQNLVHIHGTKDEVLPMRFARPTHVISGGGHLMVLSRANEINRILEQVLAHASLANAG